MRESFIFYKSFYNAISKVKDKSVKADIYDAVCELGLNEHVQELDDEVGQIIMELIKPQILANKGRYDKGLQGGRPKEYSESDIEELILQGHTNNEIADVVGCSVSTVKNVRTKTGQKLDKKSKTSGQKLPISQKPNVNDNDNVNVNVNENINNIKNIWDLNLKCDCITKNTNLRCERKATYQINGINYCNQHSKPFVTNMINDINENIKDNITTSKETSTVDNDIAKASKHKYGEYKHVMLKDKELQTLNELYGEEKTKQLITYLDEYIEMKGYKAQNHYLCIRKWVIDAVNKRSNVPVQTTTPQWYDQKTEKSEDKEKLGELEDILKEFE